MIDSKKNEYLLDVMVVNNVVFVPPKFFVSNPFRSLSWLAQKLFVDISMQLLNYPNGSLKAVISVLRFREWKSDGAIYNARRELCDAGLLINTGKKDRQAILYTITCNPECQSSGR